MYFIVAGPFLAAAAVLLLASWMNRSARSRAYGIACLLIAFVLQFAGLVHERAWWRLPLCGGGILACLWAALQMRSRSALAEPAATREQIPHGSAPPPTPWRAGR